MDPSKNPTGFNTRGKPGNQNDHQLKPPVPRQNQKSRDRSILLLTGPVKASFIYRYLISLSPIFLVIISIFTKRVLDNIFGIATSSLITAVPGYSASITSLTNITILLIAPVGIFILFSVIGWTRRIFELWTSSVLTLGLSGVTGIVLISITGSQAITGNYMLLLLQWISFLVQPSCFIAAIIVIFSTEKFRSSLRYTIKKDGLWIQGGFWRIHEHMIPLHRIVGIVFEQDLLGKQYNFGTVIPQTITRSGADSPILDIGVSGQEDTSKAVTGFSKGRTEASRDPLDCLYGIPDPKNAQKILTELIQKEEMRRDEPDSLKKNYYMSGVAKLETEESPKQIIMQPVVTGSDMTGDTRDSLDESINLDKKSPEFRKSTIVRVTEDNFPESNIISPVGYVREIPPFINPQDNNKIKTNPDPSNASLESIFDLIKKLSELRDAGIITEQEFTTKKTELLKRI